MSLIVEQISDREAASWNDYVLQNSRANIYHDYDWRKIIQSAYGHKACYLAAKETVNGRPQSGASDTGPDRGRKIVGVLPLFHMKSYLFGNNMYSIPFFDMGGVLAESSRAANALINEAVEVGRSKRVHNIELRQQDISDGLECPAGVKVDENTGKVRMILALPNSSEALMKGFKAKLRSQIKRPVKDGLYAKIGSTELLRDFYRVFAANMRDLGSPVHSIRIIANVLRTFGEKARLVVVYKEKEPLACGLVVGHKGTLANPWASSLKKYNRLSPNMLLYWTMLAFACDHGYREFDFGRSTPGEGTFRFKVQWGAKPIPLNWVILNLNNKSTQAASPDKSHFDFATHLWQKLPVAVSKIIGPSIRRHIGL